VRKSAAARVAAVSSRTDGAWVIRSAVIVIGAPRVFANGC
jgi:hypothetical protein